MNQMAQMAPVVTAISAETASLFESLAFPGQTSTHFHPHSMPVVLLRQGGGSSIKASRDRIYPHAANKTSERDLTIVHNVQSQINLAQIHPPYTTPCFRRETAGTEFVNSAHTSDCFIFALRNSTLIATLRIAPPPPQPKVPVEGKGGDRP